MLTYSEVAKLPANHSSFCCAKWVVTDCAPLVVVADLHSPLSCYWPIHKTNLTIITADRSGSWSWSVNNVIITSLLNNASNSWLASFPGLPTVQFLTACTYCTWSKTGQWEDLGMRLTYSSAFIPGHWTPTSSKWSQRKLVAPIPRWEQFSKLFSFPSQ